jgi:AhpD family alkylhydroperoxidase
MNNFKRRIYSVPGFFHDIFAVLKNPGLAISAGLGNALSSRFRQRLYLAVISVNRCRYCTYMHTREALHAGLTEEEINHLLTGDMENVPGEEQKAILYAQHWADSNGQPDPQAQADLINAYGDKYARVIEMALLLVQIGSLCGNSFDYFLYRLSFGRCGVTNRELL